MAALTHKQEKFVQEYLLDLNATQAAIRAGYSPKTARSVGSENLSKPDIAERIEEYQREQKEKFSVSFEQKQRWLSEIVAMEMGNTSSAAVSAIKELNLMDGDHAAQKIEANVKSTDSLQELKLRRGK